MNNLLRRYEEENLVLKEFNTVLQELDNLYLDNLPSKGESWKHMGTDWLKYSKVKEEYYEMYMVDDINSKEQRKEILDLILVLLMLAKRLEK